MRIIAIGMLLAVIFGVGFSCGIIYTTYVEPAEKAPLNVQLYNNLELVEMVFENLTWYFEVEGPLSDYNITGDPEKDDALQLRFCNLTVIEEEPLYILIVTKLSVREPYHVTWWDNYDLKVTFRDYTTRTSHVGRDGLYFYAFYYLYSIE